MPSFDPQSLHTVLSAARGGADLALEQGEAMLPTELIREARQEHAEIMRACDDLERALLD